MCKQTSQFVKYRMMEYHIVQIFGAGKPWRVEQITGGSLNFTIQIKTMSHEINKANKQKFPKFYSVKLCNGQSFPPPTIQAIQ